MFVVNFWLIYLSWLILRYRFTQLWLFYPARPCSCLHNAISSFSPNLLLQEARSIDFYGDLMFFLVLNIQLFHPACACIIVCFLYFSAGPATAGRVARGWGGLAWELVLWPFCNFWTWTHTVIQITNLLHHNFTKATHVDKTKQKLCFTVWDLRLRVSTCDVDTIRSF